MAIPASDWSMWVELSLVSRGAMHWAASTEDECANTAEKYGRISIFLWDSTRVRSVV